VPLGTLDRTPPPFFKQGHSALTKLMFFSALALFLMVADARFKVAQPLRAAVATALLPLQWAVLQPIRMVRGGGQYFEALKAAQDNENQARQQLALQAQRAAQVEQLTLENKRLRELLTLREKTSTLSQAAEVLYDTADPYTRRVIIDKGLVHNIQTGSPVIDAGGVLGQVTRVYPLSSEVTLVIDRDHTVPVLNARTGARSVVYGDAGSLELRFMAGNADVQEGDILTTSGVDGVYPAGLPVARVGKVERRAESAFARIICEPFAAVAAAQYVMVLNPVSVPIPTPAPADPAPVAPKKGAKR
jgi:rod shape-determining protein MreC